MTTYYHLRWFNDETGEWVEYTNSPWKTVNWPKNDVRARHGKGIKWERFTESKNCIHATVPSGRRYQICRNNDPIPDWKKTESYQRWARGENPMKRFIIAKGQYRAKHYQIIDTRDKKHVESADGTPLEFTSQKAAQGFADTLNRQKNPLTAKGKRIKKSMEKFYGKKRGNKVFYASEREGTISGVKKNPEYEVRELILFAENHEPLYNQYKSILLNLSRKAKRGVYDPAKAAILWKYWIDEAVKHYNREILGGGYSLRQNVFTVQDRKDAAAQMEAQERDDVMSGELLKNPKGRTMAKKRRTAKQRAATRKLVALNKRRAKGRRRTARRKMRRRANPRRKKSAKSHLWLVFKCRGKTVQYASALGYANNKARWSGTRGAAVVFKTKGVAAKAARMIAKERGMSKYQIGVASDSLTKTQIASLCAGK